MLNCHSKHHSNHLSGTSKEESACAQTGVKGRETISLQLWSKTGSVVIRERKYMFTWDVEKNITVVLWFGLGDLRKSLSTSSALWFEHGQPDFSFPLSLPIFKGIRKKFEQTIFSQAWKPPILFHSILYIQPVESRFLRELWFCLLLFLLSWYAALLWPVMSCSCLPLCRGTLALAQTPAAICSFRHRRDSKVFF